MPKTIVVGRSLIFGLVVACLVIIGVSAAIVWSKRQTNRENAGESASISTPSETPHEQTEPYGKLPAVKAAEEPVDDPTTDGWDSEDRAGRVQQFLSEIGRTLIGQQDQPTSLANLCTDDFAGETLRPRSFQSTLQLDGIQLDHWTDNPTISPDKRRPSISFTTAVSDFKATWSKFLDKRIKFKIVRIRDRPTTSPNQTEFETRQFVSVSGRSSQSFIEQHMTWAATWVETVSDDSTKELRLGSLRMLDFKQATLDRAPAIFADCTAFVLGQNECYEKQFLHGLNYWLHRNQDTRYFSPLGNPGLAVGDINNDGLDDLYVCQESNLPNRLFLQQPDGTARESAALWHADFLESSRSALLIDLDNDGDQDLAVAVLGGVVVASNEGSRFQVQDVLPTHDDTTSLVAADFDLDGDLDLYACVDYPNDVIGIAQSSTPLQIGTGSRVYHDSNSAGRNSLFRNEHSAGNVLKFTDVTESSGIDANNRRFTWAAAWEDYDNDGDPDLYVANDFGRNNLYQNDRGTFRDVAQQANAEDSASGMSVAWADTNRDGNMDAYISNMFSSAGSRITHQGQFKPDAPESVRNRLRRFARGSTLLTNVNGETFHDSSVEAGVNLGRWAWSSNFADINNDGWQDIVVANGYITTEDSGDL